MRLTCKRLLVVSLAVNLLLAGVIAGHAVKRAEHHKKPRWEAMFEEVATQLPAEKAAMLQERMGQVHAERSERKAAMRQARGAVLDALRAETFDPELYQQRMQAMHALRGVRMHRMADAMQEVASQLTQEERILLADAIEKHRAKRRRGRSSSASSQPTSP